MAFNTGIIVDCYDFNSVNNKYVTKRQQVIPLPAQVVKATSPDSSVFVYSKIVYQMPDGAVQECYTAETVQQILTKMNA